MKTGLNPSKNFLPTGILVLGDGTIFKGIGFGAQTTKVGEVCFNTSMTGYQEIMTDPSYASQIITFTFPHIGIVGANDEDIETLTPKSCGMIVREDITDPSNWRAQKSLDEWLIGNDLPGIAGIDTRTLTQYIRDNGAPNGIIAHNKDGEFDLDALQKQAAEWSGLEGLDLAKDVSCTQTYNWSEGLWDLKDGYVNENTPKYHVVAIDYGAKRNILRCLASAGCKVTVVPAQSSVEDILKHKPDGVFLSNGPGDPAATASYAVPVIKEILDKNIPLFGICLGHQLLALALGAQTRKMHLGHRGANQPVKDLETGKVEITSQNHGFEVIRETLPENAIETHISLFDGCNEGMKLKDKKAFSVQYHPEASPGPQDAHYLFGRFMELMG